MPVIIFRFRFFGRDGSAAKEKRRFYICVLVQRKIAFWVAKKARYAQAFRRRHLFRLHIMVGVRRFELPASWSRTKRSTELSHTPQRFSIIPLLFSVVKTKIKKLAHFGKKVSENKTPSPADPDEGEYHSPSLKSNFISSAENRYCMTSFATFLISSEAIYSTACRASSSGT